MEKERTDSVYWENYWKDVKLPINIDLKKDEYSRILNALFKSYLRPPNRKFLEIGCGSSKWLIHFYQNFGYEVYGIDYSKAACKISMENMRMMGVPGKVFCADLFTLPFQDATFDVIFSGGLIEHFNDPPVILRKMADLLAPGGYLITSIPNIESIYWKIQKLIDKEVYQTHFKIPIDMLENFYHLVGLTVDIIRYVGSFDLLSIDWSRLQRVPTLKKKVVMKLVGKTNGAVNRFLSMLSIDFTSRTFSPFIVAIGHKPSNSERLLL
jgi:2-polyprenyl-6-hydroxyphenyl methylase/3-demethylubiquinone-9 3-methyltransferase